MTGNDYDLAIVGGRCAGAGLAIRLAGKGLRVLLLDRARFPSIPNVPSSPFIHPGTMRLLDEMGLSDTEYAHKGARIERFVVNMAGGFHTAMPTSNLGLDRNYFMGIDRMLFDETLWKHAAQADNVTAKQGFAVTSILKDETGKVYGISGTRQDGESETFTADLLVGADGRFSFTARQFGAKVIDEANNFTSAAYYAEWEDVEEYSEEYTSAINTYNTGDGYLVLVIPIAERKYSIAVVMKASDAQFGAQNYETVYLERIRAIPHLWNRLKNARRTGDIVGMRPIENGYRQAYGENWALLGDALHYKDPSDGQGIYDALLEAKILAQCILDWKQNGTSWEVAGARYQQQVMDATYPTYKQTVANVKQSLTSASAPKFILKTMGRWVMQDPDFSKKYLLYIAREIQPSDLKLITPGLFVKGIINDIRSIFRRSP